MPAAKARSTNVAMPAKLGPPGTGAQAGDPSTTKKEAPDKLGVGHVQDDLARRKRTVELPATQGDRPEAHTEKYAANEEERADNEIGQHR